MEFLLGYLLFAVATSTSMLYESFWPALKSARKMGIRNSFTTSPYLSVFVFFLINVLFAPFIIFTIIIPSISDSFFMGITKIVHEPEEI